MANITLTSMANALGEYDGAAMNLEATQALLMDLIQDIEMTLTAAKVKWADKQANELTLTITNNGSIDFDPGASSVIQVTIDGLLTTAVEIDTTSVSASGNTAQNAAVSGDSLTFDLTTAIATGTPTVVTFDVYKLGTRP